MSPQTIAVRAFCLLSSIALLAATSSAALADNRQPPPSQERCGDEGETVGRIVGGIVGAIIGNKIGRGRSRLPATIFGGIIGGLVGGEIGRALDCDSKRKMAEATGRALESDQPQTWANDDAGTSGSVDVQPAPKEYADANDGRPCRTITQTVVLPNGQRRSELVTACKNEDGSWSPVA